MYIYIYTNVCVDIFQTMHSKWNLNAILFSSLISDKKIEQVFSHRSAASNILSASCFSPASFTDSMHLSCDPNLFHHWNITIESKERFLACRIACRLKHRTIGPSWRVQGHLRRPKAPADVSWRPARKPPKSEGRSHWTSWECHGCDSWGPSIPQPQPSLALQGVEGFMNQPCHSRVYEASSIGAEVICGGYFGWDLSHCGNWGRNVALSELKIVGHPKSCDFNDGGDNIT